MFNTRLLLIAIVIILILPTVSAITIHGTVYEWSPFEPLDNALMEGNSTPTQFRVAASGVYSFNLLPGDYLIKTSYYQKETLVYYSEDTLTVIDYEGNYVFDILMFPLQEVAVAVPVIQSGPGLMLKLTSMTNAQKNILQAVPKLKACVQIK